MTRSSIFSEFAFGDRPVVTTTWRGGSVTIQAGCVGVPYRDGVVGDKLEPGRHRVGSRTSVFSVDVRECQHVVPTQDVLSQDGATVRVTAIATYAVVDPVAYRTVVSDPTGMLHTTLQASLRAAITSRDLDRALSERDAIAMEVLEQSRDQVARYGVDLRSIDARDIVLTGDLRRAFAEVLTARKEGEAALERARGEVAAVRALANAARMIEQQPALLKLRALQAGGKGAELRLTASLDAAPVSRSDAAAADSPPQRGTS